MTLSTQTAFERQGRRRVGAWARFTAWSRPLPDFLIVGAQKCGTSTLCAQLVNHPQVRAAIRKEVHYFDENYRRNLDWYRAHFPINLKPRRFWQTLDSTPYYLFHPFAVQRMAAAIPNARLILLLREPVSRAYSHYQMSCRSGFEKLSFEAAIEAEEERLRPELSRLELDPLVKTLVLRKQSYLARSRYAEQLERLFRYFPREQVAIYTTEELRRDNPRVLRELFGFLDLSPAVVSCGADRNVGRYPPLADDVRDRLQTYFAAHNERLYELLGRDLGWNPQTRKRSQFRATVTHSGIGDRSLLESRPAVGGARTQQQ